ncbi:MAG: RimK family alpha-L-glutamate ligase [Nitrosomonadales bacterium]
MTPSLRPMQLEPILAMAALARTPDAQIPALITQMIAQTGSANLYMNQFQLFSIFGNKAFALDMQALALQECTIYRIAGTATPSIRLLALMAPGDATDNAPLDYLIEHSDIQLDLLYLIPGQPLPDIIPEHDVMIVAAGESSKNRAVLQTIDQLIECWPRPVLNPAEQILNCSRDGVCQRLKDLPGLMIPPTRRATRQALVDLSNEREADGYPCTVRPLDSQAGNGLAKIDSAAALTAYLAASNTEEFYTSTFIDYRSQDGLYRKVRVALIDGTPYVSHLAISDHWIVHYGSAHMDEHPERREEEAQFMREFDSVFARRHRDALRAVSERLKLDYVVIDCAETVDGDLLIFEADNRGWVHATDPVDLYPYKQATMQKLFAAFRAMLLSAMQASDSTAPQ